MVSAKPEREASHARSAEPTRLPPADSEGARRELVRRIVNSPTFARSERLGTLLTYVCNQALKGREAEINEQKIGQAVFRRSEDYDSAADGIVRSQASRLRQRLELYFQQEGADEPIRVGIPRGGYVPVFEVQSAPAQLEAEPTKTVPDTVPAVLERLGDINARGATFQRLAPWGLSLTFGLLLMALWIHDRRVINHPTTQTHPFWSHILKKDQATMVVAPDSGLVLFSNMSGQNVDLKHYLDAGYRSALNGPSQIGPETSRSDWISAVANRRYTSIVDLEAILRLNDKARTLGSKVSVRYARDLRPDDFKSDNAILLGSAAANPWVELFEHNMPFVLRDSPTKTSSVLNRNPQNGEPGIWKVGSDDPERRVFGLVAYVPSLTGDGNVLSLQGVTMSGTEAAMDFVGDDAKLLPFLNRIRRPDGTLPHFEILLETRNMGSSAIRSEILAWRTMN